MDKFNTIYEHFASSIGYRPDRHILNSAGIIRWPFAQYEMVRLGIGLYGFDTTHELNLQPISTLKSFISQVKHIEKGESIGYARMGVAKNDMEIAIVSIGYADGYLRVFGNGNAYMNYRGHMVPTIGNICMDMCMVDVTGLGANTGDEIIIFGNEPRVTDLAKWANTIPYEILTNVSHRVKRVFASE